MGIWHNGQIILDIVFKEAKKTLMWRITPAKEAFFNPDEDEGFNFPLFHHFIISCVRQNHLASIKIHKINKI